MGSPRAILVGRCTHEKPSFDKLSTRTNLNEGSANFSAKGEWLETEHTISFHPLPDKVQASFPSSHKRAVVKVVAKIETSKEIAKFEENVRKV
jgi:hypothetical protein